MSKPGEKETQKAEVNFLPQYPPGETKESLEAERQTIGGSEEKRQLSRNQNKDGQNVFKEK